MCGVSCLKYTLSFFAIITTIVGIAGIVVGSIELARLGHIDFSSLSSAQYTGFILLGTGILAFLIGLVGVVGSKKKSSCCLCIYQFSVLPLLLISLVLAGFSTYAIVMVGDMKQFNSKLSTCSWKDNSKSGDNCKYCGDNGVLSWVKEANDAINDVNMNYWGRSAECTINAGSIANQAKYTLQGFTHTSSDNGYKSSLKCKLSSKGKDWGNFMSYFEEQYGCSGMCSKTPFFTFSDSTKFPKDDANSCYKEITNFFDSVLVTIVAWAIFGFFLLNMILACCLCCHPDRKKEKSGENIYQRMNYYD